MFVPSDQTLGGVWRCRKEIETSPWEWSMDCTKDRSHSVKQGDIAHVHVSRDCSLFSSCSFPKHRSLAVPPFICHWHLVAPRNRYDAVSLGYLVSVDQSPCTENMLREKKFTNVGESSRGLGLVLIRLRTQTTWCSQSSKKVNH